VYKGTPENEDVRQQMIRLPLLATLRPKPLLGMILRSHYFLMAARPASARMKNPATENREPGRKEQAAMSFGGLWQISRGKWHRPPPLTFGGLWRRSRIHATA
jgi:hypothetical protein